MKVIHISCVAPPETGGIGQAASEMVKRLRGRGVDATLVSRKLRRTLAEPDPAWVTRLPAPIRFGNAGILAGLESMIRGADVVHLHYPFFGTAEGVAQSCLMRKKPLVITFHMDATAKGLAGIAFDSYRVIAQPAILRAARKILVSSFDYADHSSLRGFRKAHPERVIEMPFGADHSLFHPHPVADASSYPANSTLGFGNRQSFGISDGMRVIGFVGGMDKAHEFKGLPVLLKAMTLLPPNHHALIVGDGPRKHAFFAQAREMGITDRCHFAGRVTHDRLPGAYRAMDVFAFPSTSAAEAFGLVAVEAMATGVPVVASDLPGVRSVVLDRTTGLLVPPQNSVALAGAIKELTMNEPLRSALGRAAREQAVTRFDWDKQVERLLAVYRSLTQNAE
ncbi:MAG TPA: glycosyltransferase family 4 protein [Candidatus Methylomirabilis sp.]|nr:glycosyltransferase family 4 protein [Candidatus Methylomirabilis sp.]